jgi:hypothetical protein
VTAVLLAVQLLLVRPRLNRRSAHVLALAGHDAPRSRAHHTYIGLEVLKLAALVAFGAALLAA